MNTNTKNPFDQCLAALTMPSLSEAERAQYRQWITNEYAKNQRERQAGPVQRELGSA